MLYTYIITSTKGPLQTAVPSLLYLCTQTPHITKTLLYGLLCAFGSYSTSQWNSCARRRVTTVLIVKWPTFTDANTHNFTLLKIKFTYLNREIHCILMTCCISSVSFSKKCCLNHNFIFFSSNNTFFITHRLKFKHQPTHVKVNKTSIWMLFWVSYTLIIHGKSFYKDHADNCDKVMNSVTRIRVAHAGITTVFNILWKNLLIKHNIPNNFLHQPAT